MNGQTEQQHYTRTTITTTTGVGIGVVIAIIVASWTLRGSLTDVNNNVTASRTESKTDMSAFKIEVNAQFAAMNVRLTAQENSKNAMSPIEFLRWAIRLQQLNKDPKEIQINGLRVPMTDSVDTK